MRHALVSVLVVALVLVYVLLAVAPTLASHARPRRPRRIPVDLDALDARAHGHHTS